MAETQWTGNTNITIDSRDSLTVTGEPVSHGESVEIGLHVHRILNTEGLVLSSGSCWITVYREGSSPRGNSHSLFLVSGERSEEEIKVLTSRPDEEKSELILEKVCVLSAFSSSHLG